MTSVATTSARPSRRLWFVVLAFVAAVAAAGYAKFGTPGAIDAQPGPPPLPPQVDGAQIEQMVAGLAAKLEREPHNVEGWMMLARSYLVLDRPADALAAFETLRKYTPADPQLEAAIGELRGIVARSGGPASASASASASEVASSTTAPARRAAVAGRIELAPALRAKLPAGAALFVFAYAVDGPRVPLAVLKRKASELPLSFTVDDAAAMNPAFRLSMATQVIVGARISASGNAQAQPGDLQGFSGVVPVGAKDVKIEIGDVVQR